MKLGIIVFANNSGLGNQTRRLTYMLKPDRILVIDSSKFSKNKVQNYSWYDNFTGYKVDGFPTTHEVKVFLNSLTHVLVAENPLNFSLLTLAKEAGIKTYIQSNYEFCDHLAHPELTLPTKFLMPSHWKVEEMKQKFGEAHVQYLPPPIDPAEFAKVREANLKYSGTPTRFLHVVGTLAQEDRNGTKDLLAAIKFIKEPCLITIKSQHDLPPEYIIHDSRVRYQIGNTENESDLYKDQDVLVLPRRYGGLCLVCNEALMAGLPVIMPNISPNNKLLPSGWLVSARRIKTLKTRTIIDVYGVNPGELAAKMDEFCRINLTNTKVDAFGIGYNNFSPTSLLSKYEELLK